MTQPLAALALAATLFAAACEPGSAEDARDYSPMTQSEQNTEVDTETDYGHREDAAAFVLGTPYQIDDYLVMDVAFPAGCDLPQVDLVVDIIFETSPPVASASIHVTTDCDPSDTLHTVTVERSIPNALPAGSCIGRMVIEFGTPDDYAIYDLGGQMCSDVIEPGDER